MSLRINPIQQAQASMKMVPTLRSTEHQEWEHFQSSVQLRVSPSVLAPQSTTLDDGCVELPSLANPSLEVYISAAQAPKNGDEGVRHASRGHDKIKARLKPEQDARFKTHPLPS